MNDKRIVDMYFLRNEDAISKTESKYGKYLYSIAYRILSNREDSEECVNDTYIDAWNAIPPNRPKVLSTFLGKITRRIAIDRWRNRNAEKRGGGEVTLVLSELEECICGNSNVEKEVEELELSDKINSFLSTLPDVERNVFLYRYFYMDSIREISKHFGFSEAKITSMLHRTRLKLRVLLEKEGY